METVRQPKPQAHDWKPQGAKIPKMNAKIPTMACIITKGRQIESKYRTVS